MVLQNEILGTENKNLEHSVWDGALKASVS